MLTADALILPPPPSTHRSLEAFALGEEVTSERGSSRRLDDVGVEAVLGAMIEQKRRSSRPSFTAFLDMSHDYRDEHDDDDLDDEFAARRPAPGRPRAISEVFLKAR